MANLVPNIISRAGIVENFTAASSGGDGFPNTGREFVEFFSNAGGNITISLHIAEQVDGVTPDPKTVVIAPGTRVKIGPFPTDVYNDDYGLMQFTYTTNTDLTLQVFRLAVEN